GESINDKTFFLDISVTLNDHTLINLEMQVINERNWPERSLSYLSRTFDNLNSGADYSAVKPAIQIGLLDFTLFPEYPEFYSTYQFMNTKNFTIYSDKMCLSVLNLTRIDLATEEDQQYHLNDWASLFKATTWEELKMIAKQDEFINEASSTIYQLSQEETIRLQCEAREDFYRRQRSVQNMLDAKISKIESLNITIEDKNTIIENQNATIENQNATIENQNATIENQNATIENQNATIKEMADELASLRDQLSHASRM
ncbi:MAG: Rpn family recombination-promoting nuclease/putative transposase, partial [Lachnospiraceae bacterium]|nr:Rpn family recombination-promoting nuclease/putative transposase [Lachnospiraceae bacterium]